MNIRNIRKMVAVILVIASLVTLSSCGKKLYEQKEGNNAEIFLEFIRGTGAYIIEDEKVEENTLNTYKIYFMCFYPLKPDLWDLLWDEYDEKNYEYEIEIETENGVIKKVKIKDGIQ